MTYDLLRLSYPVISKLPIILLCCNWHVVRHGTVYIFILIGPCSFHFAVSWPCQKGVTAASNMRSNSAADWCVAMCCLRDWGQCSSELPTMRTSQTSASLFLWQNPIRFVTPLAVAIMATRCNCFSQHNYTHVQHLQTGQCECFPTFQRMSRAI